MMSSETQTAWMAEIARMACQQVAGGDPPGIDYLTGGYDETELVRAAYAALCLAVERGVAVEVVPAGPDVEGLVDRLERLARTHEALLYSGQKSEAAVVATDLDDARTALLSRITLSPAGDLQSPSTGDGGGDGRRPDGHGLSSSGPGPAVPAPAGASIPGAASGCDVEGILRDAWHDQRNGEPQNDPDAGLTHEQIAAEISDLAKGGTGIGGTVLGALNRAYRRGLERPDGSGPSGEHPSREPVVLAEDVFNKLEAYRKARARFGATSDEATSARVDVYNLAERCRYAVDCARDQRASREDGASQPRPEAASPVRAAEAPSPTPAHESEGARDPEGWRSMDSAPRDGSWFVAWIPRRPEDEADLAVAGVHTLRWSAKGFWWNAWTGFSHPEHYPTGWRPLPASPRPSQEKSEGPSDVRS